MKNASDYMKFFRLSTEALEAIAADAEHPRCDDAWEELDRRADATPHDDTPSLQDAGVYCGSAGDY